MASTIKVSLNIDDNGSMELTTRSANRLKKELDAIGASANQASKALNSAKMRTEGVSMGGISKQENIDYRRARGVAGTGGGGTRDFAKQAQGLGGLVQVYATFAANIFAVSAAFTALSKAQANANMEAASAQLSNTLGLNVKEVAKDVQQLTGYTLSFQDSIKAVNVGLQSGISSKNLKELIVIAKGAANVMGRDVADSIDRVIRGTAKQEQEILDELGIIIRSKQAWDEYAKSIGKAGSEALTAAEKQEGYTLAVIKAGQKQKQFANSFANPYDRLLASITEVGNTILSGVNSFFGPLVGFLADTKSALFAIIGGLTTFLLTKAIPTLRIVGDNLAAEREKNLNYAKRLVEAYSAQSSVFNKEEQDRVKQQIVRSKADLDKYGADVKATFDKISKIASKANLDLQNSLKLDPKVAAADIAKITEQLNRSIRGLKSAATSARSGSGLNEKLGEESRLQKAVKLEERRDELVKYRDSLLTGENSQLSKINIALERKNALEARSNALVAEGGVLSVKAQAAIDAINTRKNVRINTLNQSEAFANVLNNPISTFGEKTSTFFEGFKQAGKASVVGDQGPLQPGKISLVTKGMEKLTYSFQALSFVGEALVGILGKVFLWFTIITTVWSGIEWVLEKTGAWTDKSKKLADASESLNNVLKTQNEYFKTNKELLTSTDLDLASYITKYNGLAESFSQSAQKLRELKTAQDELNAGGGLNKWWENITGNQTERAENVVQTLKDRLKSVGISDSDKQTIQKIIEELEGTRKSIRGVDVSKKGFINKALEGALPFLIRLDEKTEKLALTNKTLIKSLQGLGEAANEAYGKAFDKKEFTGFASEVGQTLNTQLIKPFDNLLERYKSGAISQEAFANGVSSFRQEMDLVGPGIRAALPAFGEYLKALVTLDRLLNVVKNAKPGEDLAQSMKRAAAETAKFLSDPTIQDALTKLGVEGEALQAQVKGLKGPTTPQKTGLSIVDKADAKAQAGAITTLNTQIKTLDATIKDTTSINNRIAAIRGYTTEAELGSIKQIQQEKALRELEKSRAEAELQYFKINKDIGSTKEAREEAAINRSTQLNEATFQYALTLKDVDNQYTSNAIDNYIKKNFLLLEVFNQQIDSAQSIYDNLEKLGKISSGEKINIDAAIREAKLAEKLGTDLANLDKQYFSAGYKGSYQEYDDARNKLQAEYNLKLAESVDSTRTLQTLNTREITQAQLENRISALQSILDLEAESGKISIGVIKARQDAETELFQKKVKEAESDPQKQLNLQLEYANKLYKNQLELLEARKKNFNDSSTGEQLSTLADEAYRRLSDFTKNMRTGVDGVFDAVYGGMDAAIDELTTKMMEGMNISFKDLVTTFRNTAAEEFRKMSADQLKMGFRDLVSKGIGAITGKEPELRSIEEQQLSVLQQIAINTGMMASTTGAEDLLSGSNMNSAEDDIENAKTSAEYFATQASEMPQKFTEMLKTQWDTSKGFFDNLQGLLGTTLQFFGSSAVSIFKNILSSLSGGSSSSGGGFLKTLFDIGASFIAGSVGGGMSGTEMSAGFAASGQGMAASNYMAGASNYVPSWNEANFAAPRFAMGGVMTDRGALALNKYANGGIANTPQVAVYGEGRQPEAYVPLPDGRTIPVTMQGKNGGGNVNVNINITDNSTTSETSASGAGKDYAAMAKIISGKVREELINQKRPGGILY